MPVAEGDEIGPVWEIGAAGSSAGLIAAGNGLFRLDAAGELVRVDRGKIGYASEIAAADDGVLVGAGYGLFRLDAAGLLAPVPLAGGGETGSVTEISPAENGVRLIGATNGLFRLDGAGQLMQVPAEKGDETGIVRAIVAAGNGTQLIGADNGLFRLEPTGKLTRVPVADGGEIGTVWEIGLPENGVRLIRAYMGLFQLNSAGRLASISVKDGRGTGQAMTIGAAEDGVRLVGSTWGLFWLKGGQLVRVSDKAANYIVSERGAHLIGAYDGLYWLDATGQLAQVLTASGGGTGSVHVIGAAEKGLRLIGSEAGVFQLGTEGRLTRLPVVQEGGTGSVWEIGANENGARLLRAENGLFRLNALEPRLVGNDTRRDVRNHTVHTFEWRVRHPCVTTFPQTGLFGVRFDADEDWTHAVVQPPEPGAQDVVRVEVRRLIEEADGAEIAAILGFRPTTTGLFQPLAGSDIAVRVSWGLKDHAAELLRRVRSLGACGASGAVRRAAAGRARRRGVAWDVVTDPLWGKVGLWFWAGSGSVPTIAALGAGALAPSALREESAGRPTCRCR